MKANKLVLIAACAGVIIAGSGYAAYDYYAGNHISIEQVIPASGQASASGVEVGADKLNGTWSIQQPSNVYLSVTTSKETVNMSMNNVKGSWLVDLNQMDRMTGEGEVDLNSLSSGNSQRDGHIKSDKFLNIAAIPKAEFKVKTFENVPKIWKEGETVPLRLTGTLTVKGISKDVSFDSQAIYDQGNLKLSGATKVTFADFGMTNPHAVVLEAENDLTVRLELTLNRA